MEIEIEIGLKVNVETRNYLAIQPYAIMKMNLPR